MRDEITVGFPDTRAFATEGELFGGVGGSARSVAIHLQSDDADSAEPRRRGRPQAARAEIPRRQRAGESEHRPDARWSCTRSRTTGASPRPAGTAPSLGTIVRALGDGAWLGEYFDGQTAPADHPARGPARDARGARRGAAGDADRPGRSARRRDQARNRARSEPDPPPRPSPHGHADDGSAADAVARRCAEDDRRTKSCRR